jgi:hypothetical protein
MDDAVCAADEWCMLEDHIKARIFATHNNSIWYVYTGISFQLVVNNVVTFWYIEIISERIREIV